MNFIPLAIWAVGIYWADVFESHFRRIDGRKENDIGEFYLFGCLAFFLIGVLSK